ncbi:glycoside hydrolase family 97 protein [Dysgonomonas sp. HDW5A]|uniref:glycoside hydrolase family 97 protein n=1 Tax=Dysgonomonas sp. HDW5A TaxID=2714926 RepID=UPI00140D4989|nr:glycoside hydrolase family 97 protein [Dysgonomonas sp. HDW5A]QIK58765.1 glycoside hydrolase family 97 protein [Dysgonomonas sp. HDW5A]
MRNTNKSYILLLILAIICCRTSVSAQKQFLVQSPDNELKVNISVGNTIEYSVSHNGDLMIANSPISMSLTNGMSFGVNPRIAKLSTKTLNDTITASVYKRKEITDTYNELILKFKEGFSLVFRAYNDGIAYRFVSDLKKPFEVKSEEVNFNFPTDQKAYIPYVQNIKEPIEKQFYNSFENTYQHINISQWDKKRLAFLPLVVEGVNGKKVCITESDLTNYPGMYLYNGNGSTTLSGVFAPYPKDIKQGGHNMLQGEVQSAEPYIARYNGATNFPWRIIIISENDKELADNDMVYKLATPNKVADASWIKPGKVAWDWWNDWNLYDVDFRSGINNETYKYYIDFASQHGIEYVILDEGWAVNLQADLFQVVPEIDLKELVDYANKKNVGLILWAGYYAFNKDIEGICKHYSEMGIKGFKVDFMDRDDQPMVDFHYRAAEIAAKYHMMLDYHGTYKPTGLQRTFPNVINFEGVHGLEQMKWSPESVDQVTYDVTIPFIRMVAGPLDYTQGAMRNASKGNYRPVNSEPMSQGTRCRQLAEYIIFESPLNMLCDNPSNYMREKECTEFIANVPTVWDNTIALDGKIGEYITIAREKDNVWYVGSLTNWDARTLDVDLSFLGEGSFKAEVFKDGANADRSGHDYKKEVIDIPSDRKLSIPMASGGGYVMKIYK